MFKVIHDNNSYDSMNRLKYKSAGIFANGPQTEPSVSQACLRWGRTTPAHFAPVGVGSWNEPF